MHPLLAFEACELPGIRTVLNLQLLQGKMLQIRLAGDREVDYLAALATGEVTPTAGRVLFEGQPLHELSRSQLFELRRRIALVHDRGALISNLKLWENIFLPLLFHQQSIPQKGTEQAVDLLEKLGFHGNIWSLPGHLTSAERVITSFIRAVVTDARLIIYTDSLFELQGEQDRAMRQLITELHQHDAAPAALFLTTSDEPYLLMAPVACHDLRRLNIQTEEHP